MGLKCATSNGAELCLPILPGSIDHISPRPVALMATLLRYSNYTSTRMRLCYVAVAAAVATAGVRERLAALAIGACSGGLSCTAASPV